MPGRKYPTSYQYGFNGQEKVDELFGGDAVSYAYRIEDSRIGKFLSIDPLTVKYPFYSPYQFCSNSPISASGLWDEDIQLGYREIPECGSYYRQIP
jgi:RHS repeat-associated protein